MMRTTTTPSDESGLPVPPAGHRWRVYTDSDGDIAIALDKCYMTKTFWGKSFANWRRVDWAYITSDARYSGYSLTETELRKKLKDSAETMLKTFERRQGWEIAKQSVLGTYTGDERLIGDEH